MNILDPKHAVQQVKDDVKLFLLGVVLFIGLIILCLIIAVYAGTMMGYQTSSAYPTMNSYQYQSESYQQNFHDHRIDQWSN